MKTEKATLSPDAVVNVVADGAVAQTNIGGGRLIPVVMVDLDEHPHVTELLRVHEHLPSGDCASRWVSNSGQITTLGLLLTFTRPLQITIIVVFDLPRHARLIDQVLQARSMYLGHGKPGDRMSTTPGAKRVLIELPPTGFEEQWEKLFPRLVTQELRAAGLSRREARRSAPTQIASWRELGSIRLQ